ncbi:MAG TPA: methyltransferase domain-containing protein [Kofleriaceae bacterium]
MASAGRPGDGEYVLGTHDAEIARLEHQHRVWRPAALEAWRRAGISRGQTIIDLGCGPGFAAVDLAEVVGPTGRVIALDKSSRFLELAARHDRPQIEVLACDFDADELPVARASAAWVRWVFGFLRRPRDLIAKLARVLEPDGVFVAQEYLDNRTWRTSPRSVEIEEFVAAVRASWRAEGGDPDVALDLVPWLLELGFEVISVRPIIDVVVATDPAWEWLSRFVEAGLARLVDLGRVAHERAAAITAVLTRIGTEPGVRMVTPAVVEIIARRRH